MNDPAATGRSGAGPSPVSARPLAPDKPHIGAIQHGESERLIELRVESCISGYNASSLHKFAAPSKVYENFNYIDPMLGMKYHSRDACLTVTKIHGFEMPAKNALSFEVVLTADDSGEVGKRYYTVQKQDDDAWLFK